MCECGTWQLKAIPEPSPLTDRLVTLRGLTTFETKDGPRTCTTPNGSGLQGEPVQ
jgi:hypothetical protein